MWPTLLGDARLYVLFLRIDEHLATEAGADACSRCGGPLHVGNYGRKPRGKSLPEDLAEAYATRFSFCCGDCRRRTTPPSVRFLGRRVYLAAVVTLATAMRHGVTATRARKLGALIHVPRRTLARWRTWWQEIFPQTHVWKTLCGVLSPPPASSDLPLGMLERMQGANSLERLARVLWQLGPLTTGTCAQIADISRVMESTQKM